LRHRPTQLLGANFYALNRASNNMRLNSATCNFNFRQLWHKFAVFINMETRTCVCAPLRLKKRRGVD